MVNFFAAIVSAIRRRAHSAAYWIAERADTSILSAWMRPTPLDLQGARASAQNGDPQRWFALANETLRDAHVRAEIAKASEYVGGARLAIQEPEVYRGFKARDTPEAKRANAIAAAVRSELMSPRVNLRASLIRMQRALMLHGVSVTIVRRTPGAGPEGRERLDALLQVPGQRLGWDWDRGGEMVLRRTALETIDRALLVRDLGDEVIVIVADEDIPDPTLRGMTLGLVTWWLVRDSALRWWVRYAEKFGIPMVWASHPSGNDQAKGKLRALLSGMGPDGFAVVENGTELKELNGGARSASFQTPQEVLFGAAGREISKLVMGHTQTADVQAGTGSKASAVVGDDVSLRLTETRCAILAAAIREQLVRPYVLKNFGEEAAAKYTPDVFFDLEEREDLAVVAEAVDKLADRMDIAESDVRERTGFRQPQDGEPVLEKKAPPPALPGQRGQQPPTGMSRSRGVAGELSSLEAWALARANGTGEELLAPLQDLIDQAERDGATLGQLLARVIQRSGIAPDAPHLMDVLAAVQLEATMRGWNRERVQ